MIVTEAEAKTKRCQESFPAAQGLSPDGSAYATAWHYPPPPMSVGSGSVGVAVHTSPSLCIGSACMAWRWRGMRSKAKPGNVYTSHAAVTNAVLGLPNEEGVAVGYCGKAGHTYPG